MFKRWTQDASNALEDAYGQWVLGDDAGKSARLVLVVPPSYTAATAGGLHKNKHVHSHSHGNSVGGLQFVNVQGRPYVSVVEPGSLADQAGVQVRDAVHYAAMVEEDWQGEEADNTKYQPLVTHALHQESKGKRISYDDLRHLLIQRRTERALTTNAPIPSTIHTTKVAPLQTTSSTSTRSMGTAASSSRTRPKPICFLFRRTKQRKKRVDETLPTHFPMLFRLDDECDAAANMVQQLITTSPADPQLCQLLSQAVGIAFLRVQKILFGLSAHCGSGIVVARLEDGTWSAPSAIASYGMGVGLQLGVETTGYLLLLNSPQALQHFSAGTSFALSANLFGGLGGWLGLSPYTYTQAASLPSNTASWCGPYPNHHQYMDSNNGTLPPDDDEYNDLASTHTVLKVGESSSSNTDGSNSFNSMNMTSVAAPMVAYTVTAQGVYMGVSLEGSRIVARNDINRRVYQFSCGQQQQHSGATTSGVTSTELLTGKLTTPQEAESLYQALYQLEYQYECRQLPTKPTLQPSMQPADNATHSGWRAQDVPMINLNPVVVQKFQDWLQGGVPIRTTMTTTTTTGGGGSKLVKTLWLSIPKTMTTTTATASSHDNDNHNNGARNASLRLGLVHTPQDSQIMDDADGGGTVASEDVTLDSALLDNKNDSPLDSSMGQIIRMNVELSTQYSVALTDVVLVTQPLDEDGDGLSLLIQDVSGTHLQFLASSKQEAEWLMRGIVLLLERETSRLGVRGGKSSEKGGVSPAIARGGDMYNNRHRNTAMAAKRNGMKPLRSNAHSNVLEGVEDLDLGDATTNSNNKDSAKRWGQMPCRNYMRQQASSYTNSVPKYVHGQLLVRDIAKNVQLPLPLPLCRVLLLDSSSPVISKWEVDRGDANFEKTSWTFPPATPRELEQYQSEHQLIGSGSMCGAHRTTSFERSRNGSMVTLSETQIVDSDDLEKLAFTVNERMPRRGFSIKVKIILRPYTTTSCEATVLGEIRPVGKNMSNQQAVHKAFLLVVDELKARYGIEGVGLLAGFLSSVDNMTDSQKGEKGSSPKKVTMAPRSLSEEKKESDSSKESGLVSFEDMLKTPKDPDRVDFSIDRPTSIPHRSSTAPNPLRPEPDPAKRYRARKQELKNDEFEELEGDGDPEPLRIEVKPLPKIRLSLMPSPREEDEEMEEDSAGAPGSSGKPSKKKSSKSSSKTSSKTSKRSPTSGWKKSSKVRK